MVLYHASLNNDLDIHNRSKMFFFFSSCKAESFASKILKKDYTIYKIVATIPLELIYDDHKVQEVYDADKSDYIDNTVALYTKYRKSYFLGVLPLYQDELGNFKPYVGHLQIEDSTTVICLYVPKIYCTIIGKKRF